MTSSARARPESTGRRPLAARLDPRQPLVLDVRELGRRPGSMRRARLTAPAPGDLGTELIGVSRGAELALDLRLEAVMEGVLVSGSVRAPLVGECARCLDPFRDEVVVDVQELYAYPDARAQITAMGEGSDEDPMPQLEGDLLDLEPVVRDAVVLALPLSPLCTPDCAGLCAGCGERLDELAEDHAHEQTDPRWAALGSMLPTPDGTRPSEPERQD